MRAWTPQRSLAGAGRRCRSWCRAPWPEQAPLVPRRSIRLSWAQNERAGRCPCPKRGRLYRQAGDRVIRGQWWRPSYTVSPAGQRHIHSKPLAGRRKPRRSGASSGAIVRVSNRGLARLGPPASFNPSDQSRKRILYRKGPDRSRGQFRNQHREETYDKINNITHHVWVDKIIWSR